MKKTVKEETEEIINLHWENISIEDFRTKVHWFTICREYELSEDFMREYKDDLDWFMACKYQDMSEDFIREVQDKVDWMRVSERYPISKSFIIEFQDKLDIGFLLDYNRITQKDLDNAQV
tara:strand:+ start:42100 stop:42459 length:360 start_codon:yes stop_codon:yes gene_type:complete